MPDQTVTILAMLQDRLSQPLHKMQQGFMDLDKTLLSLNDRLKPTAEKLEEIGRSARTTFVATSAALTGIVYASSSFEQKMSRVKALTGATNEEFKRLQETAIHLGETTVFSSTQAAEAMSYFALAGFEANKIIEAMPATLNMAAAGQIALGSAADITAKIMAGMGLTADELGYAVDVLTKGFTTSNTTLEQLGEALKYVGPVGRTAGKDLSELVAVIQVMSNAGIQAGQAGTSLRNIISRLSGSIPASTKNLEELGIAVQDADGNIRNMADIVDDLRERLSTMTEIERTGYILETFGQRAGPAMAALIEEGGNAIREYERKLESAGGTAERVANIQLNNFRGKLTLLKSAVEAASISTGNYIQKILEPGIDVIIGVVKAYNKLPEALKAIAAGTGVAVAGISGFLVLLGTTARYITVVLIPGIASLVVAIKSIWLAMGPIGWAIAAVGALTTAFILLSKSHDDTTEQLNNLQTSIEDTTKKWQDYEQVIKDTAEGAELLAKKQEALNNIQKGKDLFEAVKNYGPLGYSQQYKEQRPDLTEAYPYGPYSMSKVEGFEKKKTWRGSDAGYRMAALEYARTLVEENQKAIAELEVEAKQLASEVVDDRAQNEQRIQARQELNDDLKKLELELIGFQQGERAQELAELDTWYEEQKQKYAEHTEGLKLIEELYNERRKKIWADFDKEQQERYDREMKAHDLHLQKLAEQEQNIFNQNILLKQGREKYELELLRQQYEEQKELFAGAQETLAVIDENYQLKRLEITKRYAEERAAAEKRTEEKLKRNRERELAEVERENKEKLQKQQEYLDAWLVLADEAYAATHTQRESELRLLERWYNQQYILFANHKEALEQLEVVYDSRKADIEQRAKERQEQLLKDQQMAWDELGDEIQNDMTDAFDDLIRQGGGFKEAMMGFFEDIVGAFRKMIARMIAEKMYETIFAPIVGALVGGISSGIAGAFTGGAGAGAAVPAKAEGGLLPGAPSSRDNMFIRAASGEYVLRAAAVQYAGLGFLNALNSMMVPRDMLRGFRSGITPMSTGGFNAGGPVTAGAGQSGGGAPVAAYIVADEQQANRIFNGGTNSLLRWLRDHSQEIKSIVR